MMATVALAAPDEGSESDLGAQIDVEDPQRTRVEADPGALRRRHQEAEAQADRESHGAQPDAAVSPKVERERPGILQELVVEVRNERASEGGLDAGVVDGAQAEAPVGEEALVEALDDLAAHQEGGHVQVVRAHEVSAVVGNRAAAVLVDQDRHEGPVVESGGAHATAPG